MFNGKGKFKLWARNGDRVLEGAIFHLYPPHIKEFCRVLKEHGWTINQIKKVIPNGNLI